MTTEQQDGQIPHVVRGASHDERRFIVETTAKVRQPPDVPWRAWEPIGMGMAQQSLVAGRALVIDAGGTVLGFLLVVGGVVEMLYVKRSFRGLGFGMELLAAGEVGTPVPARATTASFRAWCRAKGMRWEEPRRDQPEAQP
jgi:GNAT superfamily N-acetyltransferase